MDSKIVLQHSNHVLEKTDFVGLGQKYVGKVRDVYVQPSRIIMVATDRYSAFDRNLALVPFKGQCLTQISNFWFEQTKDIVPNHLLETPDPNVVVGKKCEVLPIEVVVRGYITGVTGTALWTLYQNGQRDFGDFVLPEGMKKNQKLPQPVITPTTKSNEHDRPITSKEIVAEKIIPAERWERIQEVALRLFVRGQEIALKKGLILVDTKYEFGIDSEDQLTLVDEIHTPDSSRYWIADSYEARIVTGEEPEYFDKEFLRLWFKDNCDPYNDVTLPEAPPEMVAELSSRYIKIYEQLTGKTFEADFETPVLERIEKNLEKFRV